MSLLRGKNGEPDRISYGHRLYFLREDHEKVAYNDVTPEMIEKYTELEPDYDLRQCMTSLLTRLLNSETTLEQVRIQIFTKLGLLSDNGIQR